MLLSVNKTKMRQMLDRLKKAMGNHEDGVHSFKLAEMDEHLKKSAPVAAQPGGVPPAAPVPLHRAAPAHAPVTVPAGPMPTVTGSLKLQS